MSNHIVSASYESKKSEIKFIKKYNPFKSRHISELLTPKKLDMEGVVGVARIYCIIIHPLNHSQKTASNGFFSPEV